MKYHTIGAFKNVENIPYCKAAVDMKVGMGVILDRENETAALPTTEAECKAVHYMVSNIDDKFLFCSHVERGTVEAGEFVRADDLTTVANLEIEFADSEISDDYKTLNPGDKLVFTTDGVIAKSNSVDDYKVYFEMIALSAHHGGGIRAKICVN